jgi:carbon starvation protein
MNILTVVLLSAVCLLAAYFTYGRLLTRLLRLDSRAETPAVTLRDNVDYVPIDRRFLLGQHFSAIAAAGPIVGPILAGVMFGWLPALLWILIGSIFIGGVHDITSLTASIRHKARSIAEVVREHMTRRSYLLFLSFIWLALLYIIVAFADITASSFVGAQVLENGETITGAGIATSSMLYLALPIMMGLLMRYAKLPLWLATVIFLPLVGVSIWVGQYIPLDVAGLLGTDNAGAQRFWNVALMLYCYAASIVPMWLLLQPRGYLGGFFLYIALAGAGLGLIFGGKTVEYPAFVAWQTAKGPLFPLLFVTIACGACSGFHSLVASGTTSKQLRRETDAKLIGYGAMLMEGMVAVVSLCCVMILATSSPLVKDPKPNFLYAQGIGTFLGVVGIPAAFGVSFGLMAFTTFVYDTLDVCTRLGRYVMEELLNWHGKIGRVVATGLTAGAPLYFLLRQPVDETGKLVPAWKVFWGLFGASNQLLAALTLIVVTIWLWRTRRAYWAWVVTGLPSAFMYTVSIWELIRIIRVNFARGVTSNPVPWIAIILVGLAGMMLLELVNVFRDARPPQTQSPASPPSRPVVAAG